MACCKAVGRLTAAVSFYLAANLRKEIKVVNYFYGTGRFFFVFADDELLFLHVLSMFVFNHPVSLNGSYYFTLAFN